MTRLDIKCFLTAILIFPCMLLLIACSDVSEPESVLATPSENSAATRYALEVNGRKIPLSEIDALIELKLFDLEWARYELRKTALSDYLATQNSFQAPHSVSVLLMPPLPPRLQLTPEQQASALVFSDTEQHQTPVRLSVFCNYQSSHCARMQTTYTQLQADYGPAISFAFYDFPQAFHQFAVSASNAARCAQTMGEFEAFHKALWLKQQALNNESYLQLAKQLKLDEKQFLSCLNSDVNLPAIEAHSLLAKAHGFNTVPVTLVNGLYLSGPKGLEVFKYFIDLELARLAYQAPASAGTVSSRMPQTETESPPRDEQEADDPLGVAESGNESALPEDMPDQDELEYKARPVVPAVGEMPLSREWIEDQLLQQAELEAHFQPAEHEVEGVRLTKLSGVAQSEFYQTLGLQEGDVLMRVNDQWVHEAQNDLFESLEKGKRVSVVLVRRGLPVQMVYTIQD